MRDNEAKMTSCLAKLRTTFSRLRLKNKYDLGPVKFAELSRTKPLRQARLPHIVEAQYSSTKVYHQWRIKMSVKQSVTTYISYFKILSHEEIERRAGLSPNTTKSRAAMV